MKRQLVLLTVPLLFLTACATQPMAMAFDPPGFFSGLLHGFTLPFSFVGSLFLDVRIYAFPNSGGWYDFGYFLGVSTLYGSAYAGT